MNESVSYPASALMIGRPGELMSPDSFPASNVIMVRELYSYEGNWLSCSFPQQDIPAARLGFGLGKFDWADYGLAQPVSPDALFYRIEVLTPEGLYACIVADESKGAAVESDAGRMDIRLRQDGHAWFRVAGWPEMEWHFESPDAALGADLAVSPHHVVLWPDMVMPRNTFALCLASCVVKGTVSISGRRVAVNGFGFYDHPRIVVQAHSAPPFGWYLYAPLRFADGTLVVSYYCEDGLGRKDAVYSAGVLVSPDGTSAWLPHSQVRRLQIDDANLPAGWEAQLGSDRISITYRVKVKKPRLAQGWGDAAGEYPAFPLLMQAEGECWSSSGARPLRGGSGIAEFVVRAGYQPQYP